MPKKKAQATFCGEKSVLVAVYVERPRRRALLPSANHHHHHHHHLHLHPANKHGGGGGSIGGNRRAELLNYSRRLRESAARSPHHQNKPISSYIQQPINQPKHARGGPARIGNWKVIIPRFLRSLTMSRGRKKKKRSTGTESTTATKARAIMQSFQVQKRKGFVAKFLAVIQKYR